MKHLHAHSFFNGRNIEVGILSCHPKFHPSMSNVLKLIQKKQWVEFYSN